MAIKLPETTNESAKDAAVAQDQNVREAVEQAEEQAPTKTEAVAEAPAAKEEKAAEPVAETAKTEAVAVAETATTPAVAQPQSSVAKASKSATALTDAVGDLADSGFDGLTVNGMSFDRVRLSNGVFLYGQDSRSIGTAFKGRVMSTTALYVIKADPTDDNSPMFFSYTPDGSLLSDGSSSEAVLQEWREDEYKVDPKTGNFHAQKYLEALTTIEECDDENLVGGVVICQIPPASIARFSGFVSLQHMKTGMLPTDYAIQFKVGPLVKKGNTTFNPWAFEAVK